MNLSDLRDYMLDRGVTSPRDLAALLATEGRKIVATVDEATDPACMLAWGMHAGGCWCRSGYVYTIVPLAER